MHAARNPVFVSLNGPDNVGKTTAITLLTRGEERLQALGSVHEHDPAPWSAVSTEDYAGWWFERSSTTELTGMLLASHARRAQARAACRIGLLDRGYPMLLAVAAATCAVKDGLGTDEAIERVDQIAATYSCAPEHAVLLRPALDVEQALAITRARDPRAWTNPYPAYQRLLFAVLQRQAEAGIYRLVVDCEGKDPEAVYREINGSLAEADVWAGLRPEPPR